MDDSIAKFCKNLACFCNHLHSSSDALKQSVDRRPVPLDSASSTFVQCLNRRVASTSSDLNLLESMSFGTVSFEELLGHCNEVYKKNRIDLLELEDKLKSFGYVPENEVNEEEEEEKVWEYSPPWTGLGLKRVEEDSSSEDSLSLQNLGLSDACLATIAAEANDVMEMKGPDLPATRILEVTDGEIGQTGYELNSSAGSKLSIHVVKDDYESLPSYMKSLAPWEELVAAVEKMNTRLSEKANNSFLQDEIASLHLGHKGRSYLLLLMRMNCLVVETIDGSIAYRVLQ